jgi:hypothetical protein
MILGSSNGCNGRVGCPRLRSLHRPQIANDL